MTQIEVERQRDAGVVVPFRQQGAGERHAGGRLAHAKLAEQGTARLAVRVARPFAQKLHGVAPFALRCWHVGRVGQFAQAGEAAELRDAQPCGRVVLQATARPFLQWVVT